jgi:hypothetical protein
VGDVGDVAQVHWRYILGVFLKFTGPEGPAIRMRYIGINGAEAIGALHAETPTLQKS